MHCLPSRVTSWLTRTSRSGSFRAIGASTSRLPFTERPAQRQRCAPEPVAVLRPQSLAWDRHREIEGKFCKVVGGVVSPLLANLYMNRFLKHWRASGRGVAFRAHVIAYADDFVILSGGHAAEALAWTRQVMARLGLALNEAKTSVRDARRERFDFLGYTFGPHRYRKDGHWYLGASPSKKSVRRLTAKVSDLLVPGNTGAWHEVRDRLNRLVGGWAAYFSYGTRLMAYRAVDNHVYDRVRHFLVRRHKVPSRGTRRYPDGVVFGELGVLRLRHVHVGARPSASR